MSHETTTQRPNRPGTDYRTWLIVAGAVLLAFLIGFGWQFVRANRLDGELERTRTELHFRTLEAQLGASAIEASRGDHDAARNFASRFFSGLQARIGDAQPAGRAELQDILAHRDEVISALSRAEPGADDLMTRLFLRYRLAMQRPDAVPLPPHEEDQRPPAGAAQEPARR